MSKERWPDKDPNELLDYRIDWKDRLLLNRVLDTIVSSSWTVDDNDVSVTTSSYAATFTTAWVDGGVLGQTYTVTNTITTLGGRTMVQSVLLKITAR